MLTLRQAITKLAFTGPTTARALAQFLGVTAPFSLRELLLIAENSPIGSWVTVGPTLIHNSDLGAGGRLSAIAIDPSAPGTIYVGGGAPGEYSNRGGCGVWKSINDGASWQPLTDNLPLTYPSRFVLHVAALALDPATAGRVYFATPVGIFRSDNGGVDWVRISTDVSANVPSGVLLIDPKSPNILYLASPDGIHRSVDFGVNWTLSRSGGDAKGLVMDPTNSQILFAAVGNGIYKTTNGGLAGDTDWTQLRNGLPVSNDISHITLALCRDFPGTLYAGYSRASAFELYRTDTAGASWSPAFRNSVDNLFNDTIGVDPQTPEIVYITGEKFWRSEDGGKSFTAQSGPHDDQHRFAADPVIPQRIYALNDGGIFRSSNRGTSWIFCGNGIANVEFFDIAIAPTLPSLIIGGTQDNGTIQRAGNGTEWDDMGLAGDGATVDIDPTNDQIVYGMDQSIDSISRSPNRAPPWTNIADGLPKNACQLAHFQVHPTQPTTVLASCTSLWRTLSPGATWSKIFTPSSGNIVRSAVDGASGVYYAGADDGRVYAGPGGANWQLVFSHPSNSSVTDIEIASSVVYVSFSANGNGRVYRLTGLPPAMTANAIAANLPGDRTVQAIGADRKLPFVIYVGTDLGVYRGSSVDGGTTWSWIPYSHGLPLAYVIDLEVHPTTGVMRAGTFGRSAFEVPTS